MADVIPQTIFTDGEEMNAVKLYQRVSTAVNNLNNQVQQGAVGDTGYIAAALTNSWVSYDGGVSFYLPQYRLLNGVTYLAAAVKNGTVGTVLTLPVGMRPSKAFSVWVAAGSNGTARIDIASTGTVAVGVYGTGGTNAIVHLTGISFVAEQ